MIREMKNEETNDIMKIWLDASIHAHDFIPAEYWQNNYSIVKEKYVPLSKTYVYLEADNILGFISIHDEHYIGAIFVDVKLQGKGIGTKLIYFVKELFNSLDLTCYKKNEKSVSFYQKMGFDIKSLQLDKETNEEEYVMEWRKATA